MSWRRLFRPAEQRPREHDAGKRLSVLALSTYLRKSKCDRTATGEIRCLRRAPSREPDKPLAPRPSRSNRAPGRTDSPHKTGAKFSRYDPEAQPSWSRAAQNRDTRSRRYSNSGTMQIIRGENCGWDRVLVTLDRCPGARLSRVEDPLRLFSKRSIPPFKSRKCCGRNARDGMCKRLPELRTDRALFFADCFIRQYTFRYLARVISAAMSRSSRRSRRCTSRANGQTATLRVHTERCREETRTGASRPSLPGERKRIVDFNDVHSRPPDRLSTGSFRKEEFLSLG